MRMFYPTANIPAADKPAPLSKTIDFEFEKNVKIKEPGTGKTKSMEDFLKETWTDAIVVIRGDQIVYENYLNGMTPNTPHQMMSATKSFGGLLGLMAVANGKVKESDLVTTLDDAVDGGFDVEILDAGQFLERVPVVEAITAGKDEGAGHDQPHEQPLFVNGPDIRHRAVGEIVACVEVLVDRYEIL